MRLKTVNVETEWCVSPSGARSLLIGMVDDVMTSARTNGYWRQEPAIITYVQDYNTSAKYRGKARILFVNEMKGYKPIPYEWHYKFNLEAMMLNSKGKTYASEVEYG